MSAVLIVGVLLLAPGCSPAGGSSGSSNELKILALGNGDEKFLNDLAAEFEKENPEVDVKISSIPEDVYNTKLETSVLAKNPPDIAVVLGGATHPQFQPLDEIVYEAFDLPLTDYNEGILTKSCGTEGELFCVGGFIGAMMLGYNVDMFEEAGIPVPSTTEPMTSQEYAALAKDIKQKLGVEYGGDGLYPVWYTDYGTYLDEEGRTSILTNPPFLGTVEALAGMIADGDAPSQAQLDAMASEQAVLQLFSESKIAMMILDSGELANGIDALGVTVGFAPTPVPEGTDAWVASWTNGFGIPIGAKNQENAEKFLALMATKGQELQLSYGQLPVRLKEAAEFEALGDMQKQFAEITTLARDTTFTPNVFAWNYLVDEAYMAIVRGDAEAEEALLEVEPKTQQILDTQWEEYDESQE